ncbi:hypothetical protein MNBD_BACTEROID06-1411 [hydrothermal vent metagenome]|uniref:Uncharacterized protein n=1 Tax=hydrothermal vent metagenome TaxID=652676 RepID=A0A3B0V427_9ZZZZ
MLSQVQLIQELKGKDAIMFIHESVKNSVSATISNTIPH